MATLFGGLSLGPERIKSNDAYLLLSEAKTQVQRSENGVVIYVREGVLHVHDKNGIHTIPREVSSTDYTKVIETLDKEFSVNDDTRSNCFIGLNTGSIKPSSRNVGIGTNALFGAGEIGCCVVIGDEAMSDADNAIRSIVIGQSAGKKLSGTENVIIGTECCENTLTESNSFNTSNILGYRCFYDAKCSTLSHNSVFGYRAFSKAQGSFHHNIGIGADIMYGALSETVSSYNILLGSQVASGSRNLTDCIGIGREVFKGAQACDTIVIGNLAGSKMQGSMGAEILIGKEAGVGRTYSDTTGEETFSLLIGWQSGKCKNGSTSRDIIGLGAQSLSNSPNMTNSFAFGKRSLANCGDGSNIIGIGTYSGMYSSGIDSVLIGKNSGMCSSLKRVIAIGVFDMDHDVMKSAGSRRSESFSKASQAKEFSIILGDSRISGYRNIVIGWNLLKKEESHEGTFAIGIDKPLLSGDLTKGNLALSPSIETPWGDKNENMLYITESEQTKDYVHPKGVALFSKSGKLFFKCGDKVYRLVTEDIN